MSDGYTVAVIDNLSEGSLKNIAHLKDNNKFEFIKGDLKNKDEVDKVTKGKDVVFHLAAHANIRTSLVDHKVDLDNNTIATLNILEAMTKYDVTDLIFSSTSAIYGEASVLCWRSPRRRREPSFRSRHPDLRLHHGRSGALRDPRAGPDADLADDRDRAHRVDRRRRDRERDLPRQRLSRLVPLVRDRHGTCSYRRFVQKRPIWHRARSPSPSVGLGVEQQRERLQKLGIDPNALRPNPAQFERVRLEAMLQELHRAGLLTDEELAAKRATLDER